MSRDLTVAAQAALAAGNVQPIVLYEGEFSAGTLRLWTGLGTVSWNGQNWLGAGQLLGMSSIQETTEVRAAGVTVSLSGMPGTLISLVLAQARQGKAGRVYLGLLDSAGAIIADPYQAFVGRLDVPEIVDAGEVCTISISYESRLIDLERPRERRYTAEDQGIDYPLDRGFDYVPALQDAVIVWGRQ